MACNHVQVMGLHRDGYVFPLTLLVTKVSGSGPDAVFMGVLKPLLQTTDAVRAWILPAGKYWVCVLSLPVWLLSDQSTG
jgi:hypothetical protein